LTQKAHDRNGMAPRAESRLNVLDHEGRAHECVP
jgi:hypothetical protein